MRKLAIILTLFVALEHFGFLIMEIFLWQTPFVQELFEITPEFATQSNFMAANQGLYNGFLSAGLIWSLFKTSKDVSIFFLLCVVVAGIFGAFTVKPTIFIAQSIPALLALTFTLLTLSKNKTLDK